MSICHILIFLKIDHLNDEIEDLNAHAKTALDNYMTLKKNSAEYNLNCENEVCFKDFFNFVFQATNFIFKKKINELKSKVNEFTINLNISKEEICKVKLELDNKVY